MHQHSQFFSDNNPLTYISSTARLNATGHCWVGQLSDFHFDIWYRPGKWNADVDTLSRYPVDLKDHLGEYTEVVPPDVVSAVLQGDKATKDRDVPWVAFLRFMSSSDIMEIDHHSDLSTLSR